LDGARGDHLAHAVEHFLQNRNARASFADRQLHDAVSKERLLKSMDAGGYSRWYSRPQLAKRAVEDLRSARAGRVTSGLSTMALVWLRR
jgi:hypothetical protein